MKIEMDFVKPVIKRNKKTGQVIRIYYYFHKGPVLVPLPGIPGSKEFSDRYQALLAEHAPQVLRLVRGARETIGTLGWVITEYTKEDTAAWAKLSESSKAVYRRHFDWLRQRFGDVLLSAFDKDTVKAIRNKRKDSPSVANMTVNKLGQLWNWADEHLILTGAAKLPPINPTTGVKGLDTDGEPAPAWPPELCDAMEQHPNRQMVTFYFLGRYTGQRRGDCCEMKWRHYNEVTGKIFVVQEKTGTRVWVPAHRRLRAHLATAPRESDYIMTTQYGGKFAKTGVTNRIIEITRDDLSFTTEDGRTYSPHGLRHLCGAALAEAGCSAEEIKAILGHLTDKQVAHYLQQANRTRLGESAMRRLEAHEDATAGQPIDDDKITTLSERRRKDAKGAAKGAAKDAGAEGVPKSA